MAPLPRWPLLKTLSPTCAANVWNIFHDARKIPARSLSAAQYRLLVGRMRAAPTFVLPARVGPGAFFTVALRRASDYAVAGSRLAAFGGATAPAPDVVIHFHTELENSHNIVMARAISAPTSADADKWGNVFDHYLLFYLDASLYSRYVAAFAARPSEFDFAAFVRDNNRIFGIY